MFEYMKMDSVPDSITTEMTDSNEIYFPFEWLSALDFERRYVQITLIDDRIAVHKPTDPDAEYKAPCKVDDNSYIRSLSLFSVRVPKQFLQALGINPNDKVNLTLEENCISIRKHTEDAPIIVPEAEESEPLLAFCCVCGRLLYTTTLVKVASKYMCNECVELVKSI